MFFTTKTKTHTKINDATMLKEKDKSKDSVKQKTEHEESIKPETTELKMDVDSKKESELKALAEDYKDKYLRSEAEIRNLSASHLKEIKALRTYIAQEVIVDFLSLIDSLEAAIVSNNAESSLPLILKMASSILLKHEVASIQCSTGELFNPVIHEAIATKTEQSSPDGVILDVLQKGYKINSRTIRPVKVCVNKITK